MTDLRADARGLLNGLVVASDAEIPALLKVGLTAGIVSEISFPINRLMGVEAVLEGLILPLRKALTLRAMDFYRASGRRIMENRGLLDYLDLIDQMGVDLLAVERGLETCKP